MLTARPDSPHRPRPHPGRGPHRALPPALALPALALLVLVALRWSPLMDLDARIDLKLHMRAVADPGLTHVNRVLTDWAWDPWTMRALCALVVIWLLVRQRERALAAWIAATLLVAALVQQGLKAAVGRPRPVWPDPVDSAHYAAFPSGHAMTATVVCGLLLWLLRRYGASRAARRAAWTVALVSVLGVGLTRLWLGVHWPSDVVGGWLLGALTAAVSAAAYERWERPV
ncbi:phosphatase PAP2 family protein [Streptomyces beihaiensis]|uniref:Phosphatase PAP2 family protein n=1 Tax=Streptomyces beihaiensis TaxID=2984495 RepID=A0ABT3TR45_9ACTN|nr:phosphatase PAP2 family protein [Streptomyces beihaiensis]MCX3059514.1 phosphatase PAP2 family protein [Streptomyces beihaiensis]